MDESERRRALLTLQTVWDDMVERLKDAVVDNEEGLRSSGYSFAFEELENRFAPRLMNLGHMMGAIQHAGRERTPPRRQYRVVRVAGDLEELDVRINARLEELGGHELHDVAIAPGDGTWHAFLTLSSPD